MATNIGVKATGCMEEVAHIAAKRGETATVFLRKERAKRRVLFGRGALYRANVMGTGKDN